MFDPIGVCSAAEKYCMFFAIIACSTSFFVVSTVVGLVNVAPVSVVTVLPGIVIVDNGSRSDLSSTLLMPLHVSFPFSFSVSWAYSFAAWRLL